MRSAPATGMQVPSLGTQLAGQAPGQGHVRAYKWICSCSVGECDFDTKKEAEEASSHKFCGKFFGIKKRRK